MHDIYKNAFDKMASHIQISWTYLAQTDDSGRTIVIQSGPTIELDPASCKYKNFLVFFYSINNWFLFCSYQVDIKTSNVLETNLAQVDKSATEDIKMSQLINSQETEVNSIYSNLKQQKKDKYL